MATDNTMEDNLNENDAMEDELHGAYILSDFDIEMGTSQTALMYNSEKDSRSTTIISLRKSLQSTLRSPCNWLRMVITTPIRFLVTKFKLLIIILCYSLFGAWMFMTLESEGLSKMKC
ncbi:hypothetical protein DICVIV_08960 [Dictyocaulus viviparus]|uniref:Uncharacterized protein n=1 Tax=Dictyocaulus viviparus TaxID=29172 RepID=A0A0D8XKA5_DICVI|nr:hypothetical protein DICVIV_08960 [Dictyocaulus viviparus]